VKSVNAPVRNTWLHANTRTRKSMKGRKTQT